MKVIYKTDRIPQKTILLIMFIWTWIIFGFNTNNPDYVFYEQAYNTYSINSTNEIGFKLLCALFKRSGMDFSTFHIILAFVLIAVIIKCLYEYTDSPVCAFAAWVSIRDISVI